MGGKSEVSKRVHHVKRAAARDVPTVVQAAPKRQKVEAVAAVAAAAAHPARADSVKKETSDQSKQDKKKHPPPPTTIDSNWTKIKKQLPDPVKRRKPITQAPHLARTQIAVKHLMKTNLAKLVSTTSEGDVEVERKERQLVGLDCEMVGRKNGSSMLGRVCIVDAKGAVIYDKFVKPVEPVADYRTRYSGIEARHLNSSSAISFEEAQTRVIQLLKGNVVVGHGLKNDFDVLKITHPSHLVRDTSKYKPFQTANGRPRKLRTLVLEQLQNAIQEGNKGHDPSIDAKCALDLYYKHESTWEEWIVKKKIHATTTIE